MNSLLSKFGRKLYSFLPSARQEPRICLIIRPNKNRVVLMWEAPAAFPSAFVSVYRSSTERLADAVRLCCPVFCSFNSQYTMIEYCCIDIVPDESRSVYYWLVCQNISLRKRLYGPYIVQRFEVANFGQRKTNGIAR